MKDWLDNLEARERLFVLGGAAFVALALIYALLSFGSDIPMIGASGAISGILGAYLIFYPNNWIKLLVPWVRPLWLPAWLVLLFFVLVDNLWPYLADDASRQVVVGLAEEMHGHKPLFHKLF